MIGNTYTTVYCILVLKLARPRFVLLHLYVDRRFSEYRIQQ